MALFAVSSTDLISSGFIKRSFIYTVAGALPLASAVILLPFYLSELPASTYGALSLYLAFAIFVQVLVSYSFDTSLYIHYHDFKNDPEKLKAFVGSVFWFMLITGAALGVLFSLIGGFVFGLVFTDARITFYPYGLIAVGTGISQAIFKVYVYFLQSREMPVKFFWSNLVLFLLIAGFTIAGLKLYPETLIGPLGGRLIAGAMLTAWVLFQVHREFGLRFDFQLLRSTFHYNHFTFIYQVQQWFITYADRFIMVLFLPLSQIGVYDLAVKCLFVIEYIITGVHGSFYPKVVATVVGQEEKSTTLIINRWYHGLSALVLVLIAGAIFVLPLLEPYLDPKKGYDAVLPWFPYIAAVYAIKPLRLYFAIPYGILKQTRPLPGIYLTVAVLKAGLLFVMIRPLGIYGVVLGGLLAGCLEIVLLRTRARAFFRFNYNAFKMVVVPVVAILAIAVLEPWFGQSAGWWLHGGYIVFLVMLLGFTYRNELPQFKFPRVS